MTLTPEQLAQIHQLIDVRMKALRHENDDHLDRALLPQKITPSENANDILGTNADGDAAWDDAGSFGVASEDYVDIELAEKADRIHRHQGVEIDNVPTGDIAATNVQDAIIELDTEKLSTTAAASTYLKLDASNDPITGALLISYASPVLDIQATSGAAEIRIASKTGNAAGLIYYVEGTPYFGEYGTSTSWGLRDIVNGVYALYVTLGGTVDILPSDSDDTEDAKVSGQTIWHDGNAFGRVKVITEPDILMAQDMAIEAQREAIDLDALMERKVEFELAEKADRLHLHDDRYIRSIRRSLGFAPFPTASGDYVMAMSSAAGFTVAPYFATLAGSYSGTGMLKLGALDLMAGGQNWNIRAFYNLAAGDTRDTYGGVFGGNTSGTYSLTSTAIIGNSAGLYPEGTDTGTATQPRSVGGSGHEVYSFVTPWTNRAALASSGKECFGAYVGFTAALVSTGWFGEVGLEIQPF